LTAGSRGLRSGAELWNGIGDGFVTDLAVDTGTDQPTMPQCETE